MLASSLDAVITIDETGSVLTFNRAAEEMFGYSAPSVLGRDIAELIIPPALREQHQAALARHLETGEETILNRRVELMSMRAGGAEFPVELTVTRVPLEGPPRFTAYVRDITDRKRAEQELRDSRARVVESADRERRRIERNLHDGAQQRLVVVGLLLRRIAMERALPDALSVLVDAAQEEAGLAISELRELARGIHPAMIQDLHAPAAARPLLSVATGSFNEEGNVDEWFERTLAACATLGERYELEIIWIDNASTDGTVDRIKAWCARDDRVKLIVNARNFGPVRSSFHARCHPQSPNDGTSW